VVDYRVIEGRSRNSYGLFAFTRPAIDGGMNRVNEAWRGQSHDVRRCDT
jgi:hypothetical protein